MQPDIRKAVGASARTAKPQPLIAITTGEPAGIGPDICVALAAQSASSLSALPARIVFLGDRTLLADRARQLGITIAIRDYQPASLPEPGMLDVVHVPLVAACRAGALDPANARYVLALLEAAADGCASGTYAAMVTAPVHKGVINDAGIPFTGHTEFLEARAHVPGVVMMLAGGGLRVALATTHFALADVPAALTRTGLERTLRILVAELTRRFGIAEPRILVAGLNPHSGEGGHLGREEIDVITPVLDRLRAEGMRLEGPLPADTMFVPTRLATADCALAMYHDQGLPVLKYASFGGGVNITLGLPYIRTSVDHGTALDLAGRGGAETGSLLAAINMAVEMVQATRGKLPEAGAPKAGGA